MHGLRSPGYRFELLVSVRCTDLGSSCTNMAESQLVLGSLARDGRR